MSQQPVKWYLFKTQRFLPFFLVQFLAAFNDNFFKNALIILFTYKIAQTTIFSGAALIQIAGGVFILPFFLLTPIAGQIADKYEKSLLIRLTKIAEIAISLFAFIGFWINDIYFLLAVLFLMGAHSAFFSPLKYSIIPQQLQDEELLSGNSFIEGSTYVSILSGTAMGGVIVMMLSGYWLTPSIVLMIAILGWWISKKIPIARPGSPDLKIDWNVIKVAYQLQRECTSNRERGAAIYAISWIWVIASVLLYALPAINKEVIHASAHVTSLMLFIFSVGLACGSLIVNQFLKGQVTGRLTASSVFLLGIVLFDLGWFIQHHVSVRTELVGIKEFLALSSPEWHLLITLFMISCIAGFYLVPLYTLVQSLSAKAERARMISALNVNNAFFMTLAAILSASFLDWSSDVIRREDSLSLIMYTMGIISFISAYPYHKRFKKE